MKPAPFAYLRPGSLSDALAALAEAPDAKVLAGGQSLVPLLSMRLAAPATARRHQRPARAGRRHRRRRRGADRGAGPARRRAGLGRRTPGAAAGRRWPWPTSPTPTIRNRGTTVGSLVHADAAAEMPVVLRLLGGSRRRRVGARHPHASPPTTSSSGRSSPRWRHDEIAVSAFFPALAPGAGVAFDEIARRHGDYALCGVAALVDGDTVRGRLPLGERRARRSSTSPACPTTRWPTWRWRSSTPPTTSTPPPTTAPSWCACSPPGWFDRHESTREAGHDRGAPPRPADRQRHRPRGPGAGPPAAVRRAAPRPRPHRHPRRLRARRLRRLHDPRRRPAGAVLPDVRGLRGRHRDHHRRGARPTPTGRSARCSRRSRSATASSAASARPGS